MKGVGVVLVYKSDYLDYLRFQNADYGNSSWTETVYK